MTVAKLSSPKYILKNFNHIKFLLQELKLLTDLTIISKNQSIENVEILIEARHKIFGENKISEAYKKWTYLKNIYEDIELRFIEKLQINKITQALQIFDIIETVDNVKLADKLFIEMQKVNKWPICYIQVNIASEVRKNSIMLEDADDFIKYVINDIKLPVKGLMCIPPHDKDPKEYFTLLKMIASKYNLPYLSMGMSNDYMKAIACGATHIRLGRAIFN